MNFFRVQFASRPCTVFFLAILLLVTALLLFVVAVDLLLNKNIYIFVLFFVFLPNIRENATKFVVFFALISFKDFVFFCGWSYKIMQFS